MQSWDGKTAYVQYKVREKLFHARAALHHVDGDRWIVMSPDFDLFAEDLIAGPDIRAVFWKQPNVMIPAALAGVAVYDFNPALTADIVRAYFDDAAVMVVEERRRLGLPMFPVGVAGDVLRRMICDLPPPADEPPPQVHRLPLDPHPRDSGLLDHGDRPSAGVTPRGSDDGRDRPRPRNNGQLVLAKDSALHGANSGDALGQGAGLEGLRAALDDGGAAAMRPTLGVPDDARTLAVKYDMRGSRFRDFKSAVDALSADAWSDWPISGPRTFAWGVRFMANQAGTPTGWHSKWKSDGKLDSSSHIVVFHGTCCQMVETLLCYDQLNGSNIAVGEQMMRQIMLSEERLKDRFGSQAPDGFDEFHLYSGRQDRYALCIDPALSEWVAKEVSKESVVMKERRKAREERALTRPKKQGKGKEGE